MHDRKYWTTQIIAAYIIMHQCRLYVNSPQPRVLVFAILLVSCSSEASFAIGIDRLDSR